MSLWDDAPDAFSPWLSTQLRAAATSRPPPTSPRPAPQRVSAGFPQGVWWTHCGVGGRGRGGGGRMGPLPAGGARRHFRPRVSERKYEHWRASYRQAARPWPAVRTPLAFRARHSAVSCCDSGPNPRAPEWEVLLTLSAPRTNHGTEESFGRWGTFMIWWPCLTGHVPV